MKKISTLVGGMLTFATFAYAQNTPVKVIDGKPGMYPQYTEFARNAGPAYTVGTPYFPSNAQLRSAVAPQLVKTEVDKSGMEHSRYQQTFNSIPIEGAVYITHAQNGKLQSQNGKWIQTFPADIAKTASVSKDAAIKIAIADFGAKVFKWQLPEEEQFLKKESGDASATFFPKPTLVYYTGEEEITPEIRLAYKMDVYAAEPLGRRIYFIDAQNGSVLGVRELIHTTNATGTAVTAYSGTQTITTDSYSGSYRLRETGRGNGIQTYNLKKGTNYNSAVDFTDADNTWNNVNAALDQYATDAHWGAEKTYDFYKTKFGRNSIDGNGLALKSYVHYSTNYFNAFWDGTRMTYGDGNSSDNNKPLTAIDVTGHEISHGLTSYTANLNYSNESGAMNEGFSDIFGTAIEWYARPSQHDWLIGADFYTLRSMSNPNQYGDPDTYQGTNWYSGTSDNGGVHTNSGVLNYWFYLLSAGGSGTNDKGTAFNVTGLGIDKAAAIAFRTLTVYLISTSKYADARTYSIKAAQDLYGASSNEVTQTTNAWNAVGVGGTVAPPTCTDNYESNESLSAAKAIAINSDITAKIGTSTDKDYFTFTTTSSAPNVKISLTNLAGDYDIRLYNSSGTQLKISQNSGTTSESITYNTTGAKTYYIQVYGYGGAYSSAVCYLLRVNTSGTSFFGESDNTEQGIVSNKERVIKSLSVYPNPASSVLNISGTFEEDKQDEVVITDIAGRMIYRRMWTVTKGLNRLQINLPKLAAGTYLLKAGNNPVEKIQIVSRTF